MDKWVQKYFEWAIKKASWWKFWDPRSGVVGAIIGGTLIVGIVYLIWS